MEKVIESLIQKINETRTNYDKAFISIGNTNIKAYVKIIKNTTNMKYQLMKQINNYKKQKGAIRFYTKHHFEIRSKEFEEDTQEYEYLMEWSSN